MKRVILIFIFAGFLLSACGGGGGGAAPSVNSDDSPPPEETRRLTPAEQAEVRTAADALLNDLDSLENNAEVDSLRQKIAVLTANISDTQRTITELQNEIAELQIEVKTLKEKPPSPPDETMTPPPMPCPDLEMRNAAGVCECIDGYKRNAGGMCEMETATIAEFEHLAEYNANPPARSANALTAYQRGFFGQGVTVIVLEYSYRPMHQEYAANVITTDTTLRGVEFRYDESHHGSESLAHGTAVAGILGGVFGNNLRTHGIAPSVRMWLTGYEGDYQLQHIPFAISNSVAIVNRSHALRAGGFINYDFETAEEAKNQATVALAAREYAAAIGDADYVEVIAAGNLNSLDINRWVKTAGYYPIIAPEVEKNMIMVVNIYENDEINNGSVYCHLAARWCLSAYGSGQVVPTRRRDTSYSPPNHKSFTGTSASAPVVSGALALLKSAAPELPMTVIRQVLLESARPLGTRKNDGMPDEVFGWGAVDVGNGIATLQAMQTADGMAYSDLRKSLPGEFSHLRGRMESVSVALRITDRSYYNMRLSDIVGGDYDLPKTSLGNAAKEMQSDDSLSPENSGFGFNYANGDYDLHYAGGGGENAFRFSGGLRHDDSQSSYIGEGSSPFSAANASDTGGYVKWTTKNYGGISAFGEYGRTQIKADYDSASFISQIKNARAEEWTAGFQYRDLFLHNDNLRFSARQESRISGGEMVLHYPIADGDSHKAFIGESVQTIRTETAKIPIKQKPQTIYTAGYSQKTENSKWSAAAEWNAATNAKGVSFAIELQIR